MKKNLGFTLTEILSVLAIIGILTAIAIPSIILVRNRINERAYESKKELILLAAQTYGQENPNIFDSNGEYVVTIGELLEKEYVEKDVDSTNSNCSSSYGCVMDPRDKTNMNNFTILIRIKNNNIISIWQGETGGSTDKDLVNAVLTELNCTPSASSPCLYPANATNNYLSYSGIMWRILGVYVIDGTPVVKLITNDTINID